MLCPTLLHIQAEWVYICSTIVPTVTKCTNICYNRIYHILATYWLICLSNLSTNTTNATWSICITISSYQPPCMPYPTPTPTCCGFDPTNGRLHPFRVHFISGNSICNGCKRKYDKALGPLIFYICLHEEWRSFTPHGSSEKQSFWKCVLRLQISLYVWSSFIPTSVVVLVEVQSKLLPQHKEFLLALLFNSPSDYAVTGHSHHLVGAYLVQNQSLYFQWISFPAILIGKLLCQHLTMLYQHPV